MKVTKFNVFFKTILFASILPYFGAISFLPNIILGFNLSGWAWLICFLISLWIIISSTRIPFKIWIWFPWVIYLSIYIIVDFSFLGLQLTLQYLVPLLVGIAASTFFYTDNDFQKLIKWTKYLVIIIITFTFIRFLLGHRHMGADTVMYISFVSTLVLSLFFQFKNIKYLFYFVLLAAVPVILLTRMGIAMMLAVLVLHFANKNIFSKMSIGTAASVIGLILFYSDPIQEKMFLDGKGDISKIFDTSEEINTSGRKYLAVLMEENIEKNPNWGNGPRSDLQLFQNSGLWITEAHNDYLSVRYNYGWVGLFILLSSFLVQFINIYKHKPLDFKLKIIYYTSLTLFIPLFGFMYSDNILKYSISFGNFFFILIGILYSCKEYFQIHYFHKTCNIISPE